MTKPTRLNVWSGALPDGTWNAPPPGTRLEIQPPVSHLWDALWSQSTKCCWQVLPWRDLPSFISALGFKKIKTKPKNLTPVKTKGNIPKNVLCVFKEKKVSWELWICKRQLTKSREVSTAGPDEDPIGSGKPQWSNQKTVLIKDCTAVKRVWMSWEQQRTCI